MHKFTILATLLIFSFGLTSAYADETFVNPDDVSFAHIPQSYLPSQVPTIIDPLTGEFPNIDTDKQYTVHPSSVNVESNEKYLVSIDGELFYLVPNPQDTTANMLAVLLLAVPFGLLVYRMSDNDPIPLKYAKLSGDAVAFAMASLMTMPITVGNSFWGYASASSSNTNIPQPIDSLYFDSLDNFSSNGATVILDKENSAISLDGDNDYLVLDSALSEKLEQFTVSAWVKPDYKK